MTQRVEFKYDVFLSFAIEDALIAKELWENLLAHNLKVFWSDVSLKEEFGESWFNKVEESLEQSQHMVVLVTKNSLNSEWVLREYRAFLHSCYKKNYRRLIPVLDSTMMITDMPLFMREFQSFKLDKKDELGLLGNMLWENSSRRNHQEVKISQVTDIKEFVDKRDQNVYPTIRIGEQVWFAENLNYQSTDSRVYGNRDYHAGSYGRLYHWQDAQMSCPDGWRIPGNDDWEELISFVGGKEAAGVMLIHGSFRAKLGGMALRDRFEYLDQRAYFWSANNYDDLRAYCYVSYSNEKKFQREIMRKELLYSIRCIMDR